MLPGPHAGEKAVHGMDKGNTSLALSEEQYTEIESAVMESERGRTFLREFLKRNRHADTMMLLDAISRLESALCLKTIEHEEPGEFTPALADIASVVTATRTEIAAIRNDLITGGGSIPEGAEPFAAAADEARSISSELLAEVEKLENLAWRLREDGADDAVCDKMDASIDELMALCWKQDVSGQRSAKAMNVLSFVSDRTGGNLLGSFDTTGQAATGPEMKALPSAAAHGDAFFQADADLFGDELAAIAASVPVPVPAAAHAEMEDKSEPVDSADGSSDEAAGQQIVSEPDEEPAQEDAAASSTGEQDGEPSTEDAGGDGGSGHIVIIRTPSDSEPKSIPEPAARAEDSSEEAMTEEAEAEAEIPLVSIPAQRPA
ncbi:MAG: hypothetical protein AAF441_04005 [Pseudomonadota bacterium]